MKQYFYYRLWLPLKKWVDRITGRRNNDNDHFNNPFIIY